MSSTSSSTLVLLLSHVVLRATKIIINCERPLHTQLAQYKPCIIVIDNKSAGTIDCVCFSVHRIVVCFSHRHSHSYHRKFHNLGWPFTSQTSVIVGTTTGNRNYYGQLDSQDRGGKEILDIYRRESKDITSF